MTPQLEQRVSAILNDPSASHWLKAALQAAMQRDPVDAANDADFLAELLSDRADHALSAVAPPSTDQDPSLN